MSQAVYASNGLAGISLLAQVRIHVTCSGVAIAGAKRRMRPPCGPPRLSPLWMFVSPWAHFGALCPVCSVTRPKSSNSSTIPFALNEDRPLFELRYGAEHSFAVSSTRLSPKHTTWLRPWWLVIFSLRSVCLSVRLSHVSSGTF